MSKISEIIRKLQEIQEKEGDLPVAYYDEEWSNYLSLEADEIKTDILINSKTRLEEKVLCCSDDDTRYGTIWRKNYIW